jgi:hypothetical protein
MFTHSFRDTYPPARFDNVPWTRVLVEQSADGATAWTQIDDQAIAVDATPDSPNPIDLTVTGTLERAWFRFRFRDAAGTLSAYTAAVLSPSTNPLTLDALKRRLGDLELSTGDDKLQEYLDAAFAQAQAPWPLGCGRLLTPDSAPRTVAVRRGRAVIPDASTITSVTVDGTAVSDYRVLRKDGYIVQITGLADTTSEAVVAGSFGFTSLPANLADAIYVLAARMHYEEAAQYADQVAVLEGTAVQNYYRQLPPRTKLVFQTYAVPAAIAGLA